MAAYVQEKRLDPAFVAELGITEISYQNHPAVRIPYLDARGAETAVRFRIGLGGDGERFRWKSGSKPIPYGRWRLKDARDAGYLVLVEGESDCHVLWSHGIPALGIPGAGNWKSEWCAHLDAIEDVFLWVEPDDAGKKLRDELLASPIQDRLFLIGHESFKDPADLHIADPEGFPNHFQAALDRSQSASSFLREQANRQNEEAWERCKDLARQPTILDCFENDLAKTGAVGEERAAKLIFLSIVSRFFDRPVSIAVKGPSSAGKSFTTEQTIRFFPDSAIYSLSGMSERFLAYDDEPVAHRMIYLSEASGLGGEVATYLVRTLLSEGRIIWGTVLKGEGGLTSSRIEREGPTGLIITTTQVKLHPENETRLFSIPVNDTQQQTRRVLRSIAVQERKAIDCAVWHALSEWLETGERRVVIPFAAELAEAIPPVAVRLRRDVGALLTLVMSHALIHRASREQDDEGRVIATIDDYEEVRELIVDLVTEGVGESVSAEIRETVNAVAKVVVAKCDEGEEEPNASVREIKAHIKLDESATRRRLEDAVSNGYLIDMRRHKNQPWRVSLGDPLPEAQEILPSRSTLEKAARCKPKSTISKPNSEVI